MDQVVSHFGVVGARASGTRTSEEVVERLDAGRLPHVHATVNGDACRVAEAVVATPREERT